MNPIYRCIMCEGPIDPGPMPEDLTKPGMLIDKESITTCECGHVQKWTSGVRDPARFRWYPIYRCMISWCKTTRHWMSPLCPEHWAGVPEDQANTYWLETVRSPRKGYVFLETIAKKVESGLWGHRRPFVIDFEF